MTCRRIYPRIEIDAPVVYIQFTSDDRIATWGSAKVLDISRGGAMFECREALGAGTLKLSIAVVGENDQVILGKVVHQFEAGAGRFRYGIKFMDNDRNRRLTAAALVKIHCMCKNSISASAPPE